MEVLGGSESHNLVLGCQFYGRVLTDVVGGQSWLRGNLEGRVELMGGGQYQPKGAYLFGLTPLLRYNFATGSRWMPFVDAGAGVSLTDIGQPDLGTPFEFNLQAGAGLNYFLRKNLALTLQYRFLHVSNARIDSPDYGVNANVVSAGLTWFF
jgi:lipid A 3-O-deacylase